MSDYLYRQECFEIIGAAMEVHNQMGNGLLEPIYQEALTLEFQQRNIPCEREKELFVYYKGIKLNKTYRVDFICYGEIVVELKAVKEVLPEHEAQLLNYLKITQKKIGLLLNFGEDKLFFRRYII